MPYWLLKSEPDEFSISDLEHKQVEPWDGVRNYQARNFIRQMLPGDRAFFYHSSCKTVGIAGVVEVASHFYEDPLAVDISSPYFDKRIKNENPWSAIDVQFERKFQSVVPLSTLKKLAEYDQRLKDLTLLKKGNRLSVMPISHEQWQCIMEQVAP